jgi:uncharacterized protein
MVLIWSDKMINREAITKYVESKLSNDSSGHDDAHLKRVTKIALNIQVNEGGNEDIIFTAAMVHDLIDDKIFVDPIKEKNQLIEFLLSMEDRDFVDKVMNVIDNMSFRKGKVLDTLEGKIVQDADRIDAIGAIGIGRTFAYGGAKNRKMYEVGNSETTVQHFYDKLLKLEHLMNTESAKKIARSRTQFLEDFLEQFYKEWNGEL